MVWFALVWFGLVAFGLLASGLHLVLFCFVLNFFVVACMSHAIPQFAHTICRLNHSGLINLMIAILQQQDRKVGGEERLPGLL